MVKVPMRFGVGSFFPPRTGSLRKLISRQETFVETQRKMVSSAQGCNCGSVSDPCSPNYECREEARGTFGWCSSKITTDS